MTLDTQPELVELKPCPFCGGDGKLTGNERDGFHAGCSQCFCEVGEAFDRDAMPDHMFRTKDEAIAAWNTRALERALPISCEDEVDDG